VLAARSSLGLFVLLPAAYVLSDGPAMWLEVRGYLPDGWYETLYAPLLWACSDSRFVDALIWYESWFYTDGMLRANYPERY
jgi:hypothetical protein